MAKKIIEIIISIVGGVVGLCFAAYYGVIFLAIAYYIIICPVYWVLHNVFLFLGEEIANLIGITGSAMLVTAVAVYFFARKANDKKEEEIKNKKIELEKYKNDIDYKLKQKEIELENKIANAMEYLSKKELMYGLSKTSLFNKFENLSNFIADLKTFDFEISENYLQKKKRPAYAEAKRIAELKKETKEYIKELKSMQYKYEYLFKLFPDLEYYIEDFEDFQGDEFTDIDDLQDNIDKARKHLSKEEYETLSEDERNQLALDRYIQSKKSKLQIGLEYEMYIGYLYESTGWNVEYFGIDKKLEDLGRDLIAKKANEVHIVQCKYWSQEKIIHEKHICQLFGTMIQYKMENSPNLKIVPVFVSSTSLSDTARKFAKYLDVSLKENKVKEEFPRIKCNINNGEKIYHLPFDQQYYRTKIDKKKGEFYAWTVEEAVTRGFRRAKKYFYTQSNS